MSERVTDAEVESTFSGFCDEAKRNGIDVEGWALIHVTNPTSWGIQVRRAGLLVSATPLPHQGFLGHSAWEAQSRMWALADGMRMVRFARERESNA